MMITIAILIVSLAAAVYGMIELKCALKHYARSERLLNEAKDILEAAKRINA